MNTNLILLLLLLSDPALLKKLKPALDLLDDPTVQALFAAEGQKTPPPKESGEKREPEEESLTELLEKLRKAAALSSQ